MPSRFIARLYVIEYISMICLRTYCEKAMEWVSAHDSPAMGDGGTTLGGPVVGENCIEWIKNLYT